MKNEVLEMLRYYGVEERFNAVKEWYDGYHFGNIDVYCPWDIINQLVSGDSIEQAIIPELTYANLNNENLSLKNLQDCSQKPISSLPLKMCGKSFATHFLLMY